MIDGLYVIIILKDVKDSADLLDRVLIGQCHIILGDHGDFRGNGLDSRFLDGSLDRVEIILGGNDLEAVLFLLQILGACVQGDHHQVIRTHIALFAVNNDLAAFVKHVGDTSGSADVAGSLGKSRTDIGGSAVLVVGESVDDHCDSVGAVAFIGIVLIVDIADISGCLFDAALDGIVGDVIGFRLLNDLCKLVVVGGIGTAFFYGYSDLSADDGKDLTLGGIVFFLFVFYVCEFRMS